MSLTEADLDTDAGTMRRDDSYVFIKLCNEIIERSVYHVIVEDKDAYVKFSRAFVTLALIHHEYPTIQIN